MGKFKVGDRVKLVNDGWGNVPVGSLGTVIGLERDLDEDWIRVRYDNGSTYSEPPRDIELAPKFAVGDRVRCVNPADSPFGLVGVIVVADVSLLVEFDGWTGGHGNYENQWYLQPADLEPVASPEAATLTIRAGGYYKTRDGRKVGPLTVNDWGGVFSAPGFVDHWYETGFSYSDKAETPTDLIAEWPSSGNAAAEVDNLRDEYGPFGEAGTDASNNNGKPKFKVGDYITKSERGWKAEGYKVTKIAPGGKVSLDIGTGTGYIADYDIDDDWIVVKSEANDNVSERPADKLVLSITTNVDMSAFDSEIDRVKRRLKKLAKRARKLGIRLDYDLAA